MKVLVLGIDGGNWRIFELLLKEGSLPNISRIITKGVKARLKTCPVSWTVPAWKCYSSGVNSGKSAIYGFVELDAHNKKTLCISAERASLVKDFWELLDEKGIVSGILNFAAAGPSKIENGFMVCNKLCATKDYAHPNYLGEELLKKIGFQSDYVSTEEWLNNPQRAVKKAKRQEELLFNVAEYLYKTYQPEFFHLSIFNTDPIQHAFFKEEIKGEYREYFSYLRDYFTFVDKKIGEFLKKINEDIYIFIVSDHGIAPLKGVFNFNIWLQKQGWLSLQKDKNIQFRRFIREIGYGKLSFSIRKNIKNLWNKFIFLEKLEDSGSFSDWWLKRIDWNKTKVIYNLFVNGFYFNPICVRSKEGAVLLEALKERSLNIKDPSGTETIIEQVAYKEEIYKGDYLDSAPNLTIFLKEGYRGSSAWIADNLWDNGTCTLDSAGHTYEGIFIASGPGIKVNYKIGDVSIYDIAPTILHIFDLPIPNNMDGRILKEILKPEGLKGL